MKYCKVFLLVIVSMTTNIMPMLQRSRNVMQLLGTQRYMSSALDVQPGQLYQHYKEGKLYKILAVARYSEDSKIKMVVYQALYETPEFGKDSVWVRPLSMFVSKVVQDGKIVSRFARLDSLPDNAQ